MKRILLLFLIIVSLTAVAQTESLSYSKVYQRPGFTKAQIYDAIREWVAVNFVNGKAVTQMENQETATVILKCSHLVSKGGFYKGFSGEVSYTIKLQAKDGRFRVEMSNMYHKNDVEYSSEYNLGLLTTAPKYQDGGGMGGNMRNHMWKEIKNDMYSDFIDLSSMLYSVKPSNETTEEDW